MRFDLTTPALLFPALSLLLLAYTNRFLALANLIRSLYASYRDTRDENLLQQIKNLRYRVHLVRNMQFFGVSAIFLCVATMFLVYAGHIGAGKVLFAIALVALMVSLAFSLHEIQLSVRALEVLLFDLEKEDSQVRDRTA
jgi:hypothetical protein